MEQEFASLFLIGLHIQPMPHGTVGMKIKTKYFSSVPLPSQEFLIQCNNNSGGNVCFRFPGPMGTSEQVEAYPLDRLLRKLSADPLPVLPQQKEAAIMKSYCPCSVRFQSKSSPLLSFPLEQLDWSLTAPVRGLDTFFTWRLNYAKQHTIQYFRAQGATDAILAQMKEQAAAGETWTAVVFDLVFTYLEHENRTLFDLNDELFPCEKLQQRVEFLEKRVKQLTKIIRRNEFFN